MNKRVIIGLVLIVILVPVGYLAYGQFGGSSSSVVSQDGITAQIASCEKTTDNQFLFTISFTVDPSKLPQPNASRWSGTVALQGYGITSATQGFQNLHGYWSATAPIKIPLIDLQNYDCQLSGWKIILNTR